MIKLYNGDCLSVLKELDGETIDLCVTSPPYFNARDYSQWETLDDYFLDMKMIFKESFRVLKNHKVLVLNVGDIVGQVGSARWSSRKIPLGAYFTVMMEKIGFEFIDDYIWDKGEPQSQRHLGNPPYPFYQYPVNCYEHILIFRKSELDKTKKPCPICKQMIVVSNSQSSIGVQSWECKNPNCTQKSNSGRGKRFSERSVMMGNYKKEKNIIDKDLLKKWRRDIVKINPVIKINGNGENKIGHTAPYPEDIPEMAIKYFSGVGDVVLDMFLGSGTSGVVSKKNNRRFIGVEINKEYFDLSKKRIDETQYVQEKLNI